MGYNPYLLYTQYEIFKRFQEGLLWKNNYVLLDRDRQYFLNVPTPWIHKYTLKGLLRRQILFSEQIITYDDLCVQNFCANRFENDSDHLNYKAQQPLDIQKLYFQKTVTNQHFPGCFCKKCCICANAHLPYVDPSRHCACRECMYRRRVQWYHIQKMVEVEAKTSRKHNRGIIRDAKPLQNKEVTTSRKSLAKEKIFTKAPETKLNECKKTLIKAVAKTSKKHDSEEGLPSVMESAVKDQTIRKSDETKFDEHINKSTIETGPKTSTKDKGANRDIAGPKDVSLEKHHVRRISFSNMVKGNLEFLDAEEKVAIPSRINKGFGPTPLEASQKESAILDTKIQISDEECEAQVPQTLRKKKRRWHSQEIILLT